MARRIRLVLATAITLVSCSDDHAGPPITHPPSTSSPSLGSAERGASGLLEFGDGRGGMAATIRGRLAIDQAECTVVLDEKTGQATLVVWPPDVGFDRTTRTITVDGRSVTIGDVVAMGGGSAPIVVGDSQCASYGEPFIVAPSSSWP